jgi:putative transcriptional regulator
LSEILKVVHEMVLDLHEVGALDDVTMRKMDVLSCHRGGPSVSPERAR